MSKCQPDVSMQSCRRNTACIYVNGECRNVATIPSFEVTRGVDVIWMVICCGLALCAVLSSVLIQKYKQNHLKKEQGRCNIERQHVLRLFESTLASLALGLFVGSVYVGQARYEDILGSFIMGFIACIFHVSLYIFTVNNMFPVDAAFFCGSVVAASATTKAQDMWTKSGSFVLEVVLVVLPWYHFNFLCDHHRYQRKVWPLVMILPRLLCILMAILCLALWSELTVDFSSLVAGASLLVQTVQILFGSSSSCEFVTDSSLTLLSMISAVGINFNNSNIQERLTSLMLVATWSMCVGTNLFFKTGIEHPMTTSLTSSRSSNVQKIYVFNHDNQLVV